MNNRREIEQHLDRLKIFNDARQTTLSSDQAQPELNFAQIRVGAHKLGDAALEISQYEKADANLGKKENVMRAIARSDYDQMREISNFFYRTSGIYKRLIDYMAGLYRYDWFITPCTEDNAKPEKVKTEFFKVLRFFDNSSIKKYCKNICKKVLLNGVYYGYISDSKDMIVVQELPIKFCRLTVFTSCNKPIIEFDLRFFEQYARNKDLLDRVLKSFPPEFKQNYNLYTSKGGNKLPPDSTGNVTSWFAMNPDNTVRFTMGNGEWPMFIAAIPVIIDLGVAKEIDLKRMQQLLLKLVIQHLPLNKNSELIFSLEEARELHNNAVSMLAKAIGVDVLTTPAEASVETLMDQRTGSGADELEKVERGVFNEMGTAQQLFNSDNSVALEKSIVNDESSLEDFVYQMQDFYNDVLDNMFNKSAKKLYYRFDFLMTTGYNYKELSKMYKEQMQLGQGKLFSQIALGQSQSLILYTLNFENNILHLDDILIPPQMSSTMSGKNNGGGNTPKDAKGNEKVGANAPQSDKAGRPTNEEKGQPTSEKTIANRESKGNA